MGNTSQPIVVNTPVTNNNSDINAPVIAPVFNLPKIVLPELKLNPNITTNIDVDAVDESFNDTQRKVLSLLITGLASGSAAVIMNESPMYYGSMGVLVAGGKKYTIPYMKGYETIAAVGGGTAVAAVMGKDAISSALILSAGSLVGDIIEFSQQSGQLPNLPGFK